ncbi:MAG: hypothetical protein IRZ15_15910 [Bryobacteraceae bacterium]|nr:hypothetical protein [Bryobacteraceae bacterium]
MKGRDGAPEAQSRQTLIQSVEDVDSSRRKEVRQEAAAGVRRELVLQGTQDPMRTVAEEQLVLGARRA